jgi:hypothetical protein
MFMLATVVRSQNRGPATNGISGQAVQLVQGIDGTWKWLISDLVGHTKSGSAPSRLAGIKATEGAIDKALAPKKKHLRPPSSGETAN